MSYKYLIVTHWEKKEKKKEAITLKSLLLFFPPKTWNKYKTILTSFSIVKKKITLDTSSNEVANKLLFCHCMSLLEQQGNTRFWKVLQSTDGNRPLIPKVRVIPAHTRIFHFH